MRGRIQKWGNSLALRIPRSVAREVGIEPGTEVDLALEEGRMVVTPRPATSPTLEDLLRGVTDENLHGEDDTGPAVGAEVW